jgi:hypothetical protein
MIGVTAAFDVGNLKAFATNGQRRPEEWAKIAAGKIVSASDSAAQPIRDQAHAYRNQIERVIANYIRMALEEERSFMASKIRSI